MAKLLFSATQGSADAFVESQIVTGLQGFTNRAYRVNEIVISYTSLVFANPASVYEVALSRRSQASFPSINDFTTMFMDRFRNLLATSGAATTDLIRKWQPRLGSDLLVAEDSIYLDFDTSGSAAANVITGYIDYDVVSISETDRLAIIASSLQ